MPLKQPNVANNQKIVSISKINDKCADILTGYVSIFTYNSCQ